jgi:hypothetical protein
MHVLNLVRRMHVLNLVQILHAQCVTGRGRFLLQRTYRNMYYIYMVQSEQRLGTN